MRIWVVWRLKRFCSKSGDYFARGSRAWAYGKIINRRTCRNSDCTLRLDILVHAYVHREYLERITSTWKKMFRQVEVMPGKFLSIRLNFCATLNWHLKVTMFAREKGYSPGHARLREKKIRKLYQSMNYSMDLNRARFITLVPLLIHGKAAQIAMSSFAT